MTARAALSFAPRLMGAAEAAVYLGMSQTTLRGLDQMHINDSLERW